MGATGRETARCNPARWAGVACLGRPFPRGSDHIWCDLRRGTAFLCCDSARVIMRRNSATHAEFLRIMTRMACAEFVQKVSKSEAFSGWPALPAL